MTELLERRARLAPHHRLAAVEPLGHNAQAHVRDPLEQSGEALDGALPASLALAQLQCARGEPLPLIRLGEPLDRGCELVEVGIERGDAGAGLPQRTELTIPLTSSRTISFIGGESFVIVGMPNATAS